MKRKALAELKDWKQSSNGSSAALIVGARRVGKSHIAEEFASTEYKSYQLIDFTRVSDQVKDIFLHQADDLDTFFTMLQTFFGNTYYRRDTVFIFDEVQAFPRARELIKHLVADGRYDYIETGSLMSIKENVKDILIPSEEHEIPMHPMDFEEFLWALGEEQTFANLQYFFDRKQPLGQAVHRKLMTLFRQYLIVGGMPEAVAEYIVSRNFKNVDMKKRSILNLYKNDVEKHGGREAMRIKQIYDLVPTQLSNNNKRFMFSAISDTARYREYENALLWLADAKVVNLCFNTTEPTVGLATRVDISAFKCYQSDTGLLISQSFSKKDLVEQEIYKKLLFNKLEFNNGLVMENAVAQMLVAAGHDLYYYAESEDRMEVDFLLTKNKLTSRKNIIPIEVKSGKKYLINSLNKYRQKFAEQVGESYVLYDGDICEKDGVTYLPVYMAGLLWKRFWHDERFRLHTISDKPH